MSRTPPARMGSIIVSVEHGAYTPFCYKPHLATTVLSSSITDVADTSPTHTVHHTSNPHTTRRRRPPPSSLPALHPFPTLPSFSHPTHMPLTHTQAPFPLFAGLPCPLDLFLSLRVPELELELCEPPSWLSLGLETSGFAGETSRGLV